jgi:hypothetical protein
MGKVQNALLMPGCPGNRRELVDSFKREEASPASDDCCVLLMSTSSDDGSGLRRNGATEN